MTDVNVKIANQGFISFDEEKLGQFRQAYEEAEKTEQKIFTFEGKELVTAYAKHLLEYMEQTWHERVRS